MYLAVGSVYLKELCTVCIFPALICNMCTSGTFPKSYILVCFFQEFGDAYPFWQQKRCLTEQGKWHFLQTCATVHSSIEQSLALLIWARCNASVRKRFQPVPHHWVNLNLIIIVIIININNCYVHTTDDNCFVTLCTYNGRWKIQNSILNVVLQHILINNGSKQITLFIKNPILINCHNGILIEYFIFLKAQLVFLKAQLSSTLPCHLILPCLLCLITFACIRLFMAFPLHLFQQIH